MFDIAIVRTALLLYSVFAIGTVLLLWFNAAAPDSTQNAGIALASLLPVLIAVLPYLNPKGSEQQFRLLLFYDADERKITFGHQGTPYWRSYLSAFSSVPAQELSVSTFGEAVSDTSPCLDLLEKAIVQSLATHFGGHWDVVIRETQTPSGIQTSATPHSPNAPKNTLSLESLKKQFRHNRFSSDIAPWGITLPPGSRMETLRGKHGRRMKLSNRFATLTISLTRLGGGLVPENGLGTVLGRTQANNYYEIAYDLTIRFEPARLHAHSPAIPALRKWYQNVVSVLQKLDWAFLSESTDRQLAREAISAVLDQRPR